MLLFLAHRPNLLQDLFISVCAALCIWFPPQCVYAQKDALPQVIEKSDAQQAEKEQDGSGGEDESGGNRETVEDTGGSVVSSDTTPAGEVEDGEKKESDDPQETDESPRRVAESDEVKRQEESKGKESSQPEPFSVTAKSLRIEAQLEGVFAAKDVEEIALRPEAWTRFVVTEAIDHGTQVTKGSVLIKFDDERLEQELNQEAINQRLEELALRGAEEEHPREVRLLELRYQEAKKRYDQLAEDYRYYLETDRPFSEKVANFRYESAKENLASQLEELDQLKKMYEADDILEETEQIVLRRQEFGVKTAELTMELQTASRDYTMDVLLPRNDEIYLTMLEQAKVAMEQAQAAMENGIARSTYNLEKKRESRAASLKRHAKLLSDRSLMTLRAPTDGTVYYGRNINGQWTEISSMANKLSPFSTVAPNTVLMTIVKQRPLVVLSSVAEKDLPNFKDGQSATITPTPDKEVELSGRVTEVGRVPGGNRKYELHLALQSRDLPAWLVAGMTCTVQVAVYENENALLIPEELVQTDKDNSKQKYVMLVLEDEEQPVRREVKLGRSKDKMVEVLEGLEEGDRIVKEKKNGE